MRFSVFFISFPCPSLQEIQRLNPRTFTTQSFISDSFNQCYQSSTKHVFFLGHYFNLFLASPGHSPLRVPNATLLLAADWVSRGGQRENALMTVPIGVFFSSLISEAQTAVSHVLFPAEPISPSRQLQLRLVAGALGGATANSLTQSNASKSINGPCFAFVA